MRKISILKFSFFPALLLGISMSLGCSNSSETEPPQPEITDNVKVGAWYFGGWSFEPDENGHTFHISPTLTTQFSNREPVWGWREDKIEVMTDQINYAADAGLSFWGFCWYENTLVDQPEMMDQLNIALDLYLKCANRKRLDFCLLSCHPVSNVNWTKLCDRTIPYFKESNYLKVDGKPVMIFFNADDVISGMGGAGGTKTALETYRQKAKDAGIGEILIGARTAPRASIPGYQDKYKECGFDFLTTYQNADDGRKQPGENDYANLIEGDKKAWNEISQNTDLPYVPTMGVGYDMRPWAADHPNQPASDYWYTGMTPQRIADHLRETIQWTKTNKDKVLGNMMLIYAWNENGEGGWLTPTKSEGTARLDAMKLVIDSENNKP